MTTELTGAEITDYARTLYENLPKAGFTSDTFEELGRASYMGKSWRQLSPDLRLAVMKLVRAFYEAVEAMDEETPAPEVIASPRASLPPETRVDGATPTLESSDDDDIDDVLSAPVAHTEPPTVEISPEVVQSAAMEDDGA